MTLTKEKFREAVFQALFSMELASSDESELAKTLSKELQISRKNSFEAIAKATEIFAVKHKLDEKIDQLSTDWPSERLQSIERTVLRLGLFEILYDKSLPPAIVIAEGIRLVKKFGQHEAIPLINALLDRAFQERTLKDQ